ncbi:hypothetical protein GCM10010253_13110 [Streptomyces badius]|uniref:Uncharacterized protein n=1 Tax=Streptomyces badius TaxID=1941 RepID=A0ABQ2SUT8_STRBA|nr:hypothetical protein GCM10010253_13110 [Streptomyces badius]
MAAPRGAYVHAVILRIGTGGTKSPAGRETAGVRELSAAQGGSPRGSRLRRSASMAPHLNCPRHYVSNNGKGMCREGKEEEKGTGATEKGSAPSPG